MNGYPTEGRYMRCYTGVLTDEGVTCQAFRSDEGELFTLLGDLGGYSVDDKVVVCGTVAEVSPCMQGVTLVVSYIGKGLPKAAPRAQAVVRRAQKSAAKKSAGKKSGGKSAKARKSG